MESLIREGALRVHTSEASCDVILSCQGHRLMAHKVILSIASPVLRDLLLQDSSEPTVMILPDINGNTMSLILDYIYCGNVIVYSNTIDDFLSVAKLFKLKLDNEYVYENHGSPHVKEFKEINYKIEDNQQNYCMKNQEKSEQLDVVSPNSPEVYSKKTQRKIPNLVPISVLQSRKVKTPKNVCNHVIPSPWCPRLAPVLGDPRNDYVSTSTDHSVSHQILRDKNENDPNNNFQISSLLSNYPKTYKNKFNDTISNYYLQKQDTHPEYPKEQDLSFNKFPYDRHRKEFYQTTNNSNYLTSTIIEPKTPPIEPDNRQSPHCSNNKTNLANYDNNNEPRSFIFSPTSKQLFKMSPDRQLQLGSSIVSSEDRDSYSTRSNDSCGSTATVIKNEISDDQTTSLTCEDVKEERTDKQKPFRCDECGKCFSQLRNYKYHRSVHEGTKEFAAKCPECGKVFNDRGYLSSHMKIHRDRKEYECPHCPKRFNQRVAYNMHLRIHTGIKPHECPTCGKSFSRKMLLKQHQRVHTGERPYSCPECGKTFADRSNMSLHARLHTGVKPYACTLCPKSFTKKHHLKTHMNFHTGLKPYTCQKCGLAFSQSSNMRTHFKKCILKSTNVTPSDSVSTSSTVTVKPDVLSDHNSN